jgi:sialate O-acetylesterase
MTCLSLSGPRVFILGLPVFSGLSAAAAVTLPPIISDHAVLQKSAKTAVWGMADPSEKVTATLGAISGQATAGADGKWRITLDLSSSGPGPFNLVVEGTNKITVADVLVGEVWVASGQSNMEFPLKYSNNGGKEIAASADPLFRAFQVENKTSPVPLESAQGKWVVADPTVSGGFTAVGYYFCKKIEQETGEPVGLLQSRWGGTPIEAWISQDALNTVPDLKAGSAKNRGAYEGFQNRAQAYADAVQAWETKYNRALPEPADPAAYAAPTIPTTDWKTVQLPGTLSAAGLPDAGAIWLRRTVTLPHDVSAGHPFLFLGSISGFDEVYWNGVKMAETTPLTGGIKMIRRYYPNALLQDGDGVLAIRMAIPIGGAGLKGPLKWGSLTLDGPWFAKVEKALPPATVEAQAAFPAATNPQPRMQDTASYLFNGMIAPITAYSIRGAIWYQGESNADRAFQYRTALPLMIADWRSYWGEGDFPFYICQLANYLPRKPAPSESTWAELREAQAKTLSVPNTGLAVLIDVGDVGNIHPHDKKTPGERLAAVALANTYGKTIPFAGPTLDSISIEGDSIRVHYTHVDGGLGAKELPAQYAPSSEKPTVMVPQERYAPASQLEGFAVCGEDHVWKWADAKIDGTTVVVHAQDVPKPVAVRYAWADDPVCNLYNGAGFPAAPFRSDDFPPITLNAKF